MEDAMNLRQLEKSLKLRVKSGCETCRKRRVKCDETKPSCKNCTKANRTCGGYRDISRLNSTSPATAATYRNSSFLVVPQRQHHQQSQPQSRQSSRQSTISRIPSMSLSREPLENRSFYYFQTYTLPQWTEFFDSQLWSQTVLQLSHEEPAVKYGVLALSCLHERLESSTRDHSAKQSATSTANSAPSDAALTQYIRAVRYSNKLLSSYQEDQKDGGPGRIEKILILCIILTCFENMAGNFGAVNMHLRNGLCILGQHRRQLTSRLSSTPPTTSQDSVQHAVANVLFRFDLQAMIFSDDTSPYQWSSSLDTAPEVPVIPSTKGGYENNEAARDDLVGLSRCMLWVARNLDKEPSVAGGEWV